MKTNKKHKTNGSRQVSQLVQVEFTHPTAATVALAGTFNAWRPEATKMVAVGDGRWLKDLALPPGTYEYLFVVDGQWLPDPLAKETVPNPFGGVNCVIKVPVEPGVNVGARRPQTWR